MQSLVLRLFEAFGDNPPPPRTRQVVRFLELDGPLQQFLARWRSAPQIDLGELPVPVMAPSPRIPGSWNLPELTTPGALAAWIQLDSARLDWFADCHSRERRAASERLRHYRYRWIGKRGGSARLLEAPKMRLKAIQRRILRDVLDRIDPHAAAHAFRRGRSVVSYVAPHAGRHFVLRIDLREFFPSVRRARVHALFRTVGYPERVARLLAALCTNSVPQSVLDTVPGPIGLEDRDRLRRVFAEPHLPQGAPTSPALANLCAWRLDCRLSGLARSAGAAYTRYADDLLFSGDRRLFRRLASFRVMVLAIVLDEGFTIHNRKTRVMTGALRQQAAGVVVNQHANIPREQYDWLKAVLYNCVRFGPASQNRAGHPNFREQLRGRIAYVSALNETRGERLRTLFDEVDWTA
ncbi:MAG TPA: reverse transcriptase family protein [Planctomycetaceae bacterium]|nr:reverse transcriptase family protein [Planctomycetaceae bacterium]